MPMFKYKAIKNIRGRMEGEILNLNYDKLFEFESSLHIHKGDWINQVDFDSAVSSSFSRDREKLYGGYGNMFLFVRARMLQRDTILLVVEEDRLLKSNKVR